MKIRDILRLNLAGNWIDTALVHIGIRHIPNGDLTHILCALGVGEVWVRCGQGVVKLVNLCYFAALKLTKYLK